MSWRPMCWSKTFRSAASPRPKSSTRPPTSAGASAATMPMWIRPSGAGTISGCIRISWPGISRNTCHTSPLPSWPSRARTTSTAPWSRFTVLPANARTWMSSNWPTAAIHLTRTNPRRSSPPSPNLSPAFWAEHDLQQKESRRFSHYDLAGIVFYPRYVKLCNGVVEDWYHEALDVNFHVLHEKLRQAQGAGELCKASPAEQKGRCTLYRGGILCAHVTSCHSDYRRRAPGRRRDCPHAACGGRQGRAALPQFA
ncbi:protein of unknown function [Georgfuchsia toluolica]|uniref:Uncharacterized protein n=1 Tax=Georgfuchsia toluolica TaxID=424218 RepID=A0A916J5R9_9PROT|nr:protein of unknown function [Georgfuchsia toluolica]